MALVFGSLARRSFTGSLLIEAGGKHYSVGWHDGAVIAADSPHPADSAVKIAISLGVISSTQAGELSQAIAAAPPGDELEVLARVSGATPDVLGRLARRVVGARAARALAPTEGEFVVTDQVPPGLGIMPIDARWILYTGLRHHFTLERLAWEVTSLATSIHLRVDYDLTGFGFGAAEEDVLGRLQDGELTVAPVPPGLDPHVVHAVALALVATGEADIVRPGVVRPRPTPPAPAQAAASPMATSTPSSSGPVPVLRPPGSQPAPMISRTATPLPAPHVSPSAPPLRPPPPMISRTATPLSSQFTPTGTPTGPAPSTGTPPHGHEAQPDGGAEASPMLPRTTTGPIPARTSTGPVPPRTTTGPIPPRTTTGPIPSRTTTGPIPSRTTTGPLPSRTTTGPVPSAAALAAAAASASTTGPIPTRTTAVPRKRNPLADDAPAIRELIAERVALLDGDADHYALLGIDRTADPNAVRAAYFELARLLHPDRLSALGIADDDRAAQRLFARINDAFTVLSTATRRLEYDTMIDAGGARAVAEREAAASAAVQSAVEAEERFRLGEMAMRRQQADIAVHEFQRAVELNPQEPDYMALLGWALYVAARDKVAALSVARAHLQKALTMKKETALPFLYLGRIARMEGEDDDASRAFRRALEIAPGNSEAQAELRVVEARRRARPSARGGLFSRLGKKP
jgi:curved DNA-binding protein CbpA